MSPVRGEPGERVERLRAVAVETVCEFVDGDDLSGGENPAQHRVPGPFVGAVVSLELEAPEAAAEGREGSALAHGCRGDVSEKDRDGPADDLLDHLALEGRDRLGDQRHVARATLDRHVRERMRAGRSEMVRQVTVGLRMAENVGGVPAAAY